MITSQEQFRRTLQALSETTELLDKPFPNMPKDEEQALRLFYCQHITKLTKMINEWRAAH